MNLIKSIKVGMALNGIKTQKELAELANIGEMTVSKILSGKMNPSVELVEKIAISMGYLVSEFYALGE